MSVARGIERRLERLVDGLAARLFRGRMHPVELGTMLVREADLGLVEGAAGPTAPNEFRVVMGGDAVDAKVLDTVATELAAFLEDAAAERGWRLEGPARVTVLIAPDLRSSDVEIEVAITRGELTPWALLRPLDPRGRTLSVRHFRALVGRSADADVRVTSDTVSRVHALIWQESGAAWIADLESSNGTFVNGERAAEPSPVVAGDVLTFGDVGFTIVEP
jgi:hypothetical protein